MTNKLTIEEVERLIGLISPPPDSHEDRDWVEKELMSKTRCVLNQLVDTMRENERMKDIIHEIEKYECSIHTADEIVRRLIAEIVYPNKESENGK